MTETPKGPDASDQGSDQNEEPGRIHNFVDFRPVFQEKPEDSAFLLALPEDFDYDAAGALVEREINEGRYPQLTVVKAFLKLPVYPPDNSATIVILNVILESKRLCGYASGDLIINLLLQRRAALKALMEDAPTDSGE